MVEFGVLNDRIIEKPLTDLYVSGKVVSDRGQIQISGE
jgi:hypothetical protein